MDYWTFFQFCERWQAKANRENPDEGLDQCFDHFFASFVVYNCIYNFCYSLNPPNGSNKGDHYRAVDLMATFANNNNLVQRILDYNQTYIDGATSLLLSNRFYIYDKNNKGIKKETTLKQELSSQDKSKAKLKAVLELLYMVRCNMFHGEKEFVPRQQTLLKPLNHILDSIITIILDTLHDISER